MNPTFPTYRSKKTVSQQSNSVSSMHFGTPSTTPFPVLASKDRQVYIPGPKDVGRIGLSNQTKSHMAATPCQGAPSPCTGNRPVKREHV